MSSGQQTIFDLQCSRLLSSAINCIFYQNIQFIKGYVPLLLSAVSPTVNIHQYVIYTKTQAMLAANFTKQCDKCSFIFTLYESVLQTMINVINIVIPTL